jgi:prepilin-type N-terminal cleavage/methylation domain-containing protein
MKPHRPRAAGFTLFEVIMALMIIGLISGAVYSISTAALETTRTVQAEQTSARRLEAFLRIVRDTFQNLPAEARVFLQMGKSMGGAPVPEMVFAETSGAFGISSLGGGSAILAARPRPDGTRVFSILRIPAGTEGAELDRLLSQGAWMPLLPGVEKVAWSFYNAGEWVEEWPEGQGRPVLVRLEFDYIEMPGARVNAEFWIPPLAPPQEAPPGGPGAPAGQGQNIGIEAPTPNEAATP